MEKQINNIDDLIDILSVHKSKYGNLKLFIRDINCNIHQNINVHIATDSKSKEEICMLDI